MSSEQQKEKGKNPTLEQDRQKTLLRRSGLRKEAKEGKNE